MKKKIIGTIVLIGFLMAVAVACGKSDTETDRAVTGVSVETEAENEKEADEEVADITETGENQEADDPEGPDEAAPVDFNWKKDMTVSLFIGIDNSNNLEDAESDMEADTSQSTMADALFLLVTDTAEGTSRIIGINRDTITEVDVYDANGEFFRSMEMQIALAHGYGGDEETQCENTVKAVSNLFGRLPIDHYAALKMAAVPTINDEFGGVEVTVLEDMTKADSALVEGADVTLQGEQALTYIKWRDMDILDSTSLRVERQKQYLTALAEKMMANSTGVEDIMKIKDMISQYMVTNCTDEEIIDIFRQFQISQLDDASFLTVPGNMQDGDVYAEFIVDQEALNEMEMDVLCE